MSTHTPNVGFTIKPPEIPPWYPPTWREDKNCISYWLPRLMGADVMVPQTKILTTSVQLVDLMDCGDDPDGFAEFITALGEAVLEVGYPAFLRTGHTSGKHNWDHTCYVTEESDLACHVYNLVEHSELCGAIPGLPHHVWAAREMLNVQPICKCTSYGNMPVVREFRFFSDEDGDIKYVRPYWPIDALNDGDPDEEITDSIYGRLSTFVNPSEEQEATRLASRAAYACRGDRWSIDVLETCDGFYVTDMALAKDSFGYDEDRYA